jgi:hypothetical protein
VAALIVHAHGAGGDVWWHGYIAAIDPRMSMQPARSATSADARQVTAHSVHASVAFAGLSFDTTEKE